MQEVSPEQIGKWLRRERLKRRLQARREGRRDFSVEKVARRIDVGEKTLRLWEKGVNPPPADKFFALVVIYDAVDEIRSLFAKWEKAPRRPSGGARAAV